METYDITFHRIVEHETTFRVFANNEEEAIDLILDDNYDSIISDAELGEIEDPDVTDVKIL